MPSALFTLFLSFFLSLNFIKILFLPSFFFFYCCSCSSYNKSEFQRNVVVILSKKKVNMEVSFIFFPFFPPFLFGRSFSQKLNRLFFCEADALTFNSYISVSPCQWQQRPFFFLLPRQQGIREYGEGGGDVCLWLRWSLWHFPTLVLALFLFFLFFLIRGTIPWILSFLSPL